MYINAGFNQKSYVCHGGPVGCCLNAFGNIFNQMANRKQESS